MKYFFSEIDEITLTFGDIHLNKFGMEYIKIYFERPTENGFDFLESTLPALNIKNSHGFNQQELQNLLEYARNNAFLIWDIARENLKCKKIKKSAVTDGRPCAVCVASVLSSANRVMRFQRTHLVATFG
ncbi:MAG: hypothetical protein IJT73_06055 [Selenomonadaceae bacterium]|nr:hypothetical protein [Selenomonadaceae bacterium]